MDAYSIEAQDGMQAKYDQLQGTGALTGKMMADALKVFRDAKALFPRVQRASDEDFMYLFGRGELSFGDEEDTFINRKLEEKWKTPRTMGGGKPAAKKPAATKPAAKKPAAKKPAAKKPAASKPAAKKPAAKKPAATKKK